MHIRPFRHPDDEEAVVALWGRCGLLVPWNDPCRDIARRIQHAPELFLVGIVDGRIVATVMAGYDGHRGWLNYVGVDPEFRRRGLGRVLIRAAEDRLRALGCPKINLQVRHSNLEAAAFYRAIGYADDSVISLGKRLEYDGP